MTLNPDFSLGNPNGDITGINAVVVGDTLYIAGKNLEVTTKLSRGGLTALLPEQEIIAIPFLLWPPSSLIDVEVIKRRAPTKTLNSRISSRLSNLG